MRIHALAEAGNYLESLVDLLADAVDDGASVGFLAPLDRELARTYWQSRIDSARTGQRVLLIAEDETELLGSVQLAYPEQENGKTRAEVQRLLVFRDARRKGVGTALMHRLHEIAEADGRRVLFLNTRTGDPPEELYRRLGYTAIGTIPDFAMNPDGTLNTTTIMYRRLPG